MFINELLCVILEKELNDFDGKNAADMPSRFRRLTRSCEPKMEWSFKIFGNSLKSISIRMKKNCLCRTGQNWNSFSISRP